MSMSAPGQCGAQTEDTAAPMQNKHRNKVATLTFDPQGGLNLTLQGWCNGETDPAAGAVTKIEEFDGDSTRKVNEAVGNSENHRWSVPWLRHGMTRAEAVSAFHPSPTHTSCTCAFNLWQVRVITNFTGDVWK